MTSKSSKKGVTSISAGGMFVVGLALILVAYFLFFYVAPPPQAGQIQAPGIGGQQPGAPAVSGPVKTLTLQTLVENAVNQSRYGATAATVDVMTGCTAKPATAGALVAITETNLADAATCGLSSAHESITCATASPQRCTSAKTYQTGQTILFHASTTEKGGSYDSLYILTLTNNMAVPSGGGDEIWDIPALKVYDRVDNDYVLFRGQSPAGVMGGEADGNTLHQNSTTGGTSANNHTLRSQSADYFVRIRINNIAGERATCFGCSSVFLRNVNEKPQLVILSAVMVISINTNVGESGLLGAGWTKLSGGYPTANKTFYKVLNPLIADNSGSTTQTDIKIPVDLSTISGQTTTTIGVYVADMQIPADVAQGAGTTAGTTAAAFAFSTRGITALQGTRYTTTSGNQVAGQWTTVMTILKGVA